LIDACAREAPAALKYALSLQGLMRPVMRLPLVEPDDNTKAALAKAMTALAEPTTSTPRLLARA
jgi:4-hydroxy-tetrahydrodipicolinate synthase